MDMPHAIRTPWWRTLKGKIPTGERMANIFPATHTTLCRICSREPETDRHFWIDCGLKWRFWMQLMKELNRADLSYHPDSLWSRIQLQNINKEVDFLPLLSRGMLAIWLSHWRCIRHQQEWSPVAAWHTYLSIQNPVTEREQEKEEDEWYFHTLTPNFYPNFITSEKPVKARLTDMAKYKKGYVTKINWYDVEDESKVIITVHKESKIECHDPEGGPPLYYFFSQT